MQPCLQPSHLPHPIVHRICMVYTIAYTAVQLHTRVVLHMCTPRALVTYSYPTTCSGQQMEQKGTHEMLHVVVMWQTS